jgi:hypothetical protein
MPLFSLNPSGSYCAEFQLGPMVGLANEDAITRLHDDFDVFLADFFGGV